MQSLALCTLVLRRNLGKQQPSSHPPWMCNLYSHVKGPKAIIDATRAMMDRTGNLPPQPGIFPDYLAPIVRNTADGRELAMARWGVPTPPWVLLKGKPKGTDPRSLRDPGTTNVRKTGLSWWRQWLGVEHRCVVPFTSFSEPEGKGGQPIWFALGEDRPLAFFAGIHVPRWTSIRKVKDGPTTNDLFAFLTTDPNKLVEQFHDKAMPAILTSPEEIDTWLSAPIAEALELQRPLPDDALVIVARGSRQGDGEVPTPADSVASEVEAITHGGLLL
jgi:putative SOS response-associated peptidase YedK